jgi:hypothetical protein
MALDVTPRALEEIKHRAEWLEGRKPLVVVYWERDSMDLRRTPTGQTEWYVARPGFWEVAVQPLEEFPSETKTHPALHTVAGYAVLAEDKDKVPVTGRFTLDFGDGEFKLYPLPNGLSDHAD